VNASALARLAACGGALVMLVALLPGSVASARQGTSMLAATTTRVVPTGTTRVNQNCPDETAFYDPGQAQDVVAPKGYKVQVFARDLNQPTGVAFVGDGQNFKVVVQESGSGLPSRCNLSDGPGYGGRSSPTNPFTPDLLVLDSKGNLVSGPIGKPSSGGSTFQPDGPAIGLAFQNGLAGGTLFSSDSNQQTDGGAGPNNSSRIVTVNLDTGAVTPFISGLPTGDHPTEQVLVKDGWVYWSQGSATNSGVVGRDNGGGKGQQDIPCQDVKLSNNVFDSGGGIMTSPYSAFGVQRPGAVVPAFETASYRGVCTGAILRARIHARNPSRTIQPFSSGYRNPYAIRFAPEDHALGGGLLLGENGEDERGSRPTNNAPDRLQLAQVNPDGTPDYHGWPDQFGFLASTQATFNPVGGPADDLCGPPAMAAFDAAACAAAVRAEDVPVKPALAYPPQTPKQPISIMDADASETGIDFAGAGFTSSLVKRGAALVTQEGDFGFSPPNGTPEGGHDVLLFNFNQPGQPFSSTQQRFAFNCAVANQAHTPDGGAACTTGGEDQAFEAMIHGINRPTFAMFGPDGALYVVDYGAVRDLGAGTHIANPAEGPLVEIPFTGTIYRISRA
jgi:glucose/arabinose dehydrogenase